MKLHTLISMLACSAVLAIAARPAVAAHPDPEDIAQHCIQRMVQLTSTCVQRNVVNASVCVERIEALLEAGHPGAAVQAAQHCAVRITQRTSVCSATIELLCGRCTLILVANGAPGLAQLVQNACAEAVATVQSSRDAALSAIQNALPDP